MNKEELKRRIDIDINKTLDDIEKDIIKKIGEEIIRSAHEHPMIRRGGDYRIGLRKAESIILECFEKKQVTIKCFEEK